jgi:ABC-type branched-subunit amino acid transport system ATPase component/ABC-type branched-subunit amino acid transport system permease subunit
VTSYATTTEPEGSEEPARSSARGSDPLRRAARSLAPAAAIVGVQQVFFPAPGGIVLRGVIVGGLTALIALGMALVYRANRILNFAQADLGFAPAVLAYLLLDEVGLPWPLAVLIGLTTALVLGAATERVVIRRFFRAPRLLLTIATIGLSQVLVAGALLLPRLWDRRLVSDRIAPPSDATARIGGVVFDANDLLALGATPVVVVIVALVLQRSTLGTAIRAGADDPDRASLLGVPVPLLHTAVWSAAAGLAFITVFLRGGILGLPTGELLGFTVLLRSLVALMLGRLTNLVTVTTSAVALGVLELGIAWEHSVRLVDPILGLIVVGALLLRRDPASAGRDADADAWRFSDEVRAIPARAARVPLVRWGRGAVLATVLALAVALPHLVTVDRSLRASALLIYAVLGVSLVLLSGWGGHVSLGQVAFFAIGAAVAGWMTGNGSDLLPALVGAALAGAVAATVVAVPASRLSGLPLAVVTFAFSLATTSYLLNREFFDWVPRGRIERPPLLGGLEVSTPTHIYYAALVLLILVALAARGIRASRTGRAIIALRDNERSAQGYGIHPVRLRLATFAMSGAIAALAGGLFIHHQQGFDGATYAPIQNLVVFTMVVIGGLSTVTGAVLGAAFLLGTRWFLPGDWQILATGVGVLLVLWLAPGGLASLVFRLRDRLVERAVTASGAQLDEPSTDLGALSGDDGSDDASTAAPAPGGEATRPEGGPALLTVEDLDASYGPVQVLFGIDLEVGDGEAVALLGTNGAGKSTVLRAVSGLLEPDRGRIRFAGEDITGVAPHRIARAGIGHMPGGAGVFPSLTVAENLRVAGWLHRSEPEVLAQSSTPVHRLFPTLAERANQPADSLSGGQQQMLALAMVLLTRPRLLLIDELTLGLAPKVVERLLDALDELREHTTIVLVDQSVNLALEVCDRALFLERGQVRYSGPAHELRERSDLLRSVFLSRAGQRDAPAGDGDEGTTAADRAAAEVEARAVPAMERAAADHASATPALEATSITHWFGGVAAVQDASIEVGQGEIVGLIGPNGAGKTTLFDVLSGFLAAQGGEVRLDGRDITRARPSRRARAGLGRSFQDARLFPSLTVAEAIAVARERWVQVREPLSAVFRLPAAQDSEHAIARRVDELIDLLGLDRYRSAFVGELSTGTRRVVDLACLLAHEPDVVLLDEPAAGIAQREVEALAPLLRRVRDEAGASLLVIEHDLPFVETISDRLIAMDQGRVIAAGTPSQVLEDDGVIAAYLGTSDTAVTRSDRTDTDPSPRPTGGTHAADP